MLTQEQRIDLESILIDNDFTFLTPEDVIRWREHGDNLESMLSDAANEQEVIYNSCAMEYLTEHDVSLSQSMQLASDLDYSVDKINSELLATLLLQQKLNDSVSNLVKEIEEFFDRVQ